MRNGASTAQAAAPPGEDPFASALELVASHPLSSFQQEPPPPVPVSQPQVPGSGAGHRPKGGAHSATGTPTMPPKIAASPPPGLDLAPGKAGPPLAALADALASFASPATPPATPPPPGVQEGATGSCEGGGDRGGAIPWLWPAETEAGRREALKVEGYVRQFREQQQQEEKKKRRMQERQAQRQTPDCCACGATPSPRVGLRLSHGGPACERCSDIAANQPMPALRDAPLFTPTEAEFEDPLAYIRSIQPRFFDYGICRIRPPPSWNPPRTFHRRQQDAVPEGGTGRPAVPVGGRAPAAGAAFDLPAATVGGGVEGGKREGAGGGVGGGVEGGLGGGVEGEVGGGDEAGCGAGSGTGEGSERSPLNRPSDVSYAAINDETQFSARLQKVAPRRSHRGHASPFLCTFVPDHTSLALGQLKQLDAQMRNGAFPELARIATDVNGRSHGDDSCSGGAGNGGCNGEGHGGCSGDEGSRSSGNGVGNGHGACAPRAANGATAAAPAPEQVEFYFWERLAAEREARLLYASDVEGTAFPAAGAQGRTISRDERWSLQQIATHDRSLLRFVGYDIPGVNTPMLYFGMLFSMFCWHVEDNYMYSISYLHEGAPKTWYGVSPRQSAAFDRVFADAAFPKDVEADPTLLIKKASMVPPSLLASHGVRVCRAVQQPSEFVVTLPQAYHSGFSHGFNAAEAVNFMLPDWLPYALSSARWYRRIGQPPVLDMEHLLIDAVRADHSPAARTHLSSLVDDELRMRDSIRADARPGETPELIMTEEDRAHARGRGPPCLFCAHTCHMSFVQLGSERTLKRRPSLACLRHADHLPRPGRVLFVRYTDSELRQLCAPPGDPADHPRHAGAPCPSEPSMLPPPPPSAGMELPPVLPASMARALADRDVAIDAKRQRIAARAAAERVA